MSERSVAVPDIAPSIAESSANPPGVAARLAFRSHPLDGAMLHFHPATGTHVRIADDTTRHLQRQAPRVVMFGITNRCNLACDFCSRDVGRDSRWSVASAVAVLRDLAAAGTVEVAFGGGEPFAFKGFAEVVQELFATTPLALNVTTNGALLQPKNFAAYASRFGQVRVSLYDGQPWRSACRTLAAYGQRWGANLIVDPACLPSLPAVLAELAALGCDDVSLLAYVGNDPRKHLSARDRAQLAAIVEDAPLRCRMSVCFGHQVAAPRLFDGADGSGDCGAGLDFVTITPDQRLQSCSFQEGGWPASTAAEILHAWRQQRAALRAASPRQGCARQLPWVQPRAVPPIAIWQAFSGNNSGECVMVAKFDRIADAQTYLAQLLPTWTPDAPFPQEWQRLLQERGICAAPVGEWTTTPTELLAIGRSVLATGYDAEDMFAELRALAWKQGAYLVPGGVHVHDNLSLLAAVRGANPHDARALADLSPHSDGTTYLHGDMVLVTLPLHDELAEFKTALETYAGPRPLAAEIADWAVSHEAMIAVKQHLGVDMPKTPRLYVRFWGEGADEKAADFARWVSVGQVAVCGGSALVSGVVRRKRLVVSAYRRGAEVKALDGAALHIFAYISLKPTPKGQPTKSPLTGERVEAALHGRLSRGDQLAVKTNDHGFRGVTVSLHTTAPEHALAVVAAVVDELGATSQIEVSEAEPLALAVRRLMDDVRQG